ncbi:hypothetical protein O1611_g653 [Lasiodiplodia mahajangana]|uniref:Uncharacterized protein n=1 Tax=Lasiodiplodia mahajangana TaxID=1108764 RepID=A0ACC2K071_9PEZI|nr:hypothetical protein O1611_g653 [Lasiodiplodia mahajangana]
MTPPTYTTHPILDDFSAQQAVFGDSSRRISRHPNGQRIPGAMRVVKPSSASNSPQTMMARRRTLMNDGSIARRRQQILDQAILQQLQDTPPYYTHQQQVKQSSRPVSWHPSSQFPDAQQMHMQMPQVDYDQFTWAMPAPYYAKECFTGYQNLPPTPAVYSGNTSPVSGFSPLLLPYGPATQSSAIPAYIADSYVAAPQFVPHCYKPLGSPNVAPPSPVYTNPGAFYSEAFPHDVLQSCTTPPTPEECQRVYHTQSVPSEESIPYQPLEEPSNEEEEGEILVGMGLYDLPSKADTDPELGHYHTTTSQLLDTTYRSGKGWKLEEAWEPPASDDEEAEEDADGDDQGDELKTTESPPAQQSWI